jgi:hypothetical protein
MCWLNVLVDADMDTLHDEVVVNKLLVGFENIRDIEI